MQLLKRLERYSTIMGILKIIDLIINMVFISRDAILSVIDVFKELTKILFSLLKFDLMNHLKKYFKMYAEQRICKQKYDYNPYGMEYKFNLVTASTKLSYNQHQQCRICLVIGLIYLIIIVFLVKNFYKHFLIKRKINSSWWKLRQFHQLLFIFIQFICFGPDTNW